MREHLIFANGRGIDMRLRSAFTIDIKQDIPGVLNILQPYEVVIKGLNLITFW